MEQVQRQVQSLELAFPMDQAGMGSWFEEKDGEVQVGKGRCTGI